jgi:hypothetical protein
MSQSNISWFLSQPVKIRDDGDPGAKGAFDKDGKPVLDPATGQHVGFRPERPAWPEGSYVLIKGIVEAGDVERVNDLQLKSRQIRASENAGAEMSAELGILSPAIIYGAVFITGFLGSVFTDPDTCQRDAETGELLVETGSPMKMPADDGSDDAIKARVAVVKRLPAQVAGFVLEEVSKRIKSPLDGTVPLASDSKTGPEPTSIQRSAGSRRKK